MQSSQEFQSDDDELVGEGIGKKAWVYCKDWRYIRDSWSLDCSINGHNLCLCKSSSDGLDVWDDTTEGQETRKQNFE